MKIIMFYHSLLSCWNHGNAHFLRGVATELQDRGHTVRVYEPRNAWSLQNLLCEYGETPLKEFSKAYPSLRSIRYDLDQLDLEEVTDGAGLVLVHEWNDPDLVRRLGQLRARSRSFRLLFHDTHHRSVTDRSAMARFDLSNYDGVLAYGNVIRDIYLSQGWAQRAWTWHEAADTRVFHPMKAPGSKGDLVWIGNWGDDERTAELHEFLLDPVRALGLKAKIHGVRYPQRALQELEEAGVEYGGWLPNWRVPETFARYRLTVHVPRRPYVRALPGIPTIRPFEALACAMPLVTAPWEDAEGLFTPGKDYLVARNGEEMRRHLKDLLHDPEAAAQLGRHGRRTILARHTCAHRVDELLDIHCELEEMTLGKAATA